MLSPTSDFSEAFAGEPMAEQGRECWTNLVADFEASDLTQRAGRM